MSESPTEHFEHAEHAEHVSHMGDPFLTRVSVTIALLAVIAATIGSLETVETSAVTVAKSEAVLAQNKATDAWNFFQAKSVKGTLFQIAADAATDHREDYLKQVARYNREQSDIQKEAQAHEHDAEEQSHNGEGHERKHHILTVSATLLHIAIAIATISIVMRGLRWPWYGSIALGVAGVVTAAVAYI